MPNRTFYCLDDAGQPVPEGDCLTWALWISGADTLVAYDNFGAIQVSTIYIGVAYSRATATAPLLWETMVFGGKLDGRQARYASRADAEHGHARMLKLVAHRERGDV